MAVCVCVWERGGGKRGKAVHLRHSHGSCLEAPLFQTWNWRSNWWFSYSKDICVFCCSFIVTAINAQTRQPCTLTPGVWCVRLASSTETSKTNQTNKHQYTCYSHFTQRGSLLCAHIMSPWQQQQQGPDRLSQCRSLKRKCVHSQQECTLHSLRLFAQEEVFSRPGFVCFCSVSAAL